MSFDGNKRNYSIENEQRGEKYTNRYEKYELLLRTRSNSLIFYEHKMSTGTDTNIKTMSVKFFVNDLNFLFSFEN